MSTAKRKEQKRKAMAAYRKRHPERVRQRVRAWRAAHPEHDRKRREARRQITDILKDVPCTDCGGRFPSECMDFDHVRGEKKFGVSRGLERVSLADLHDEIAKCDVVCANCHRIRTAKQLNWRNSL